MRTIDAENTGFSELNETIRETDEDCHVLHCLGQRFIAAGMQAHSITIDGVPGNALGAYLNGAEIIVHGNAQDAVGDTMNDGTIIVHGSIGDAAGYAMRGGKIFVRGDAGYRAGIHMKEYAPANGPEKIPVMVIGGCAGSFLGEYQAGGIIFVLGFSESGRRIVGNFPCTGMHGGKMILRGDHTALPFPRQVTARIATDADIDEFEKYLSEYCELFGRDKAEILNSPFTIVTPDSKNPYKQMYVAN